jgi:hypothetical protein
VVWLRFPFPVGELLAKGHFFEFADGGSGDSVDEDESIRDLPLGERSCEKAAQFLGGSAKTILQHVGRDHRQGAQCFELKAFCRGLARFTVTAPVGNFVEPLQRLRVDVG